MFRNTIIPMFTNRPGTLAVLTALIPMVSLTAALWLSATLAHSQTAAVETPPAAEAGVDINIKPGDDFFAYANGGWLKATEIPFGKGRWGARDEIAELTRQRVLQLLADAAAAATATTAGPVSATANSTTDSTARKVADFHAAYLNEAAIEAKGIAPVKSLLNQIDRVRDKAALTRLLGSSMRTDVDPLNTGVYSAAQLLGLAVQASIHGEKTYVAFLLQGGLGLPDREHYLSAAPRLQALRTQYQQYIARMLAAIGGSREGVASKRAEAVMALETAIAESHATREASSEDHNADNVWTRADFARQAPGMDWSLFFTAANLSKQQTFVAWQPSAIKGAAALIASQPLQVWKDYLRFHIVHARADVLPKTFSEPALAMRAAVVAPAAPAGPAQPAQPAPRAQRAERAQRANDVTQAAMGEALGRMYVERYFPAAHKARIQAIAANVIAALGQRIEAVTWMSPHSKTMAQAKLKTLYFGVGYPEQWQDYADLIVDPAGAVGNMERIAERNYRRALARLGKNIDQTEWSIAPQTPGAILRFHQNAYNFAAALLQMPKFDPEAPGDSDAANYGAIGAIIGHEASHLIDTLGAEYESDGRMRRWWTGTDMAQYEAATAALVNQYSRYQPFADLSVNGKVTLVENLADLGGLAAAFDAYRRTLGSRISDKEYVRQQDRQFFIGFARSWRGKMNEAGLRKYVTTDNHAPESYRIATVRNLDAWYDAFDVLPGQQLYLEPKARLRIW